MATSALPDDAPRVLLVDDEVYITNSLQRDLRRHAYVFAANSARDALAFLAEHEVDVVVSDERMPEMSGAALLAEVRRRHPSVYRVMLTGNATTKHAIDTLNDGVYQYLQKPHEPEALLKCILDATVLARIAADKERQIAQQKERHAALGNAIATLWMAAQPIVDADNRAVFAYEFLLRAREASLPHAGAILDVAEELGRVTELERAIRRAIAAIAPRVPEPALLFVNLHPSSLGDPDLLDPEAPLTAYAHRIVLEVTEREALDRTAADRLRRIRALGYRIAVDDLGAGYAGLNYLNQIKPDFVKLDMELVRDIDTISEKAVVVAGAYGICRDLGYRVIAEGIESSAEQRVLNHVGIGLLQGYLFARPDLPFPEIRWQ